MPRRDTTVFDEGSVEAMLRSQEQDNEFCRRLLAAIHLGREFCPVGVVTQPSTKKPVYMRPPE